MPEIELSQMFAAAAFYAFAGIMLAGAVGCVISTNIVRTALCLLGTLTGAAGLYFLLFANLLAVIQLIVYAGGTLVLIIFGVMLTSKSPWMTFAPTRGESICASLIGAALFVGMVSALWSTNWEPAAHEMASSAYVHDIGRTLLTAYIAPFELASVLLLVVMIGAAYMARPEQR
jgi:NADH-quinone oxidoreductase subunit J